MKNEKNFYNIEELKKYIKEEENVNYVKLLNYASPINHDYHHNSKSTPLFEFLLENIPNIWQKIEYKEFDTYISAVKGESFLLAEKVINIIQHYAEDKYWTKFIKKLGKDIKQYPVEDHQNMWEIAILKYSPDIFTGMDLIQEAEDSIGEKKVDDIILRNIDKLSISHKWEIDSALNRVSANELFELIKKNVEEEKFHTVYEILHNESLKNTKILSKQDILQIKIGEKSLADYCQEKKEEYTVNITGQTIDEDSYEKIDMLFRKNLLKDEEKHNYKLNYFNLVECMENLDINNMLLKSKKMKCK